MRRINLKHLRSGCAPERMHPRHRLACPGSFSGISEKECLELQCCFDTSVQGVPHCFLNGTEHHSQHRKNVAYFGPQRHHAAALEHCGFRVLRFDYFHPMVSSVTDTYDKSTVKADIMAIPLRNNSVHGAIVLHVLEHVSSLERAVNELARVILPGGWLHTETPTIGGNTSASVQCNDTTAVAGVRGASGVCAQPDHVWAHTTAKLHAVLASAGFKCFAANSLFEESAVKEFALDVGLTWFNFCRRKHN